jgi:hypothetical protein
MDKNRGGARCSDTWRYDGEPAFVDNSSKGGRAPAWVWGGINGLVAGNCWEWNVAWGWAEAREPLLHKLSVVDFNLGTACYPSGTCCVRLALFSYFFPAMKASFPTAGQGQQQGRTGWVGGWVGWGGGVGGWGHAYTVGPQKIDEPVSQRTHHCTPTRHRRRLWDAFCG